ncbi:MAG: cell division protein FtsQ/DivIB [Aureispira sp.]
MKVNPKRMSFIIKRLSLTVGGFAVILLIVAAVQYRKKSIVSDEGLTITIINNEAGNKFIRERDVVELLFKEFRHAIVGQSLEQIDIEEVEQVLEEDIFIKDADVYVDALNNVHITIEQRVPVARIMDEVESSYYLDEEGDRVRTSSKFTARVMVVTGKIGRYSENYRNIPHHRLGRVLKLVQFINADPFWKAQFEQIHIDHSGEATLIPKLGDHKVKFGQPHEDIEDKFHRLEVFYQDGLPVEGWDKYKSINLSFKGQVVAKKR